MSQLAHARACLDKGLAAISAAEDELGRLDAAAGDGDHGSGMVRGLRAAVAAEGESAGDYLRQAGAAFGDAAGGASGALYAALLGAIGQALPPDEQIDAAAVQQALEAGQQAIMRLGKAKVGDKTMIDTLDPFVRALGEQIAAGAGLAEAWRQALPAAEQGMQGTADMISKRGRSARLRERSRGHLDPGARSMFYLLRAAGEALDA